MALPGGYSASSSSAAGQTNSIQQEIGRITFGNNLGSGVTGSPAGNTGGIVMVVGIAVLVGLVVIELARPRRKRRK